MKVILLSCLTLVMAVTLAFPLSADTNEEPADTWLKAMEKNANDFLVAYNAKDLDAIMKFYDEDVEVISDAHNSRAIGIDSVREIFRVSFENAPKRFMSLHVESVSQVTENVVIEDGVAHFSDTGNADLPQSFSYSTTFVKNAEGEWKILKARHFQEVMQEESPLEPLAWLVSDWSSHDNQLRLDLTLRWEGEKQIVGESVVQASDGTRMKTDIRIGWDSRQKTIKWWTFDSQGGFAEGEWQQVAEGWIAQTRGVTSLGESRLATQELKHEDDGSIHWHSKYRFLNGVAEPDVEMRLVKRPPRPSKIEL